MSKERSSKYDIALSFAGEDRDYVEKVAMELKARGVNVFYDRFETATLWGKNLYAHLQHVYQEEAGFTVIFISEHYATKGWTNHELKAAQARAFDEFKEYILPARFDDTQVEGILDTTGYIDLRKYSPTEVCGLICEKLGIETVADPTERFRYFITFNRKDNEVSAFIQNIRKLPNFDESFMSNSYSMTIMFTKPTSPKLIEELANTMELDLTSVNFIP